MYMRLRKEDQNEKMIIPIYVYIFYIKHRKPAEPRRMSCPVDDGLLFTVWWLGQNLIAHWRVTVCSLAKLN